MLEPWYAFEEIALPSSNQGQDGSFVFGGGWCCFNPIINDHSSLEIREGGRAG